MQREWGPLLQSQGDNVRALTCSPDGSLLAFVHDNAKIQLRNMITGALEQSWRGLPGPAYCLAFSSTGLVAIIVGIRPPTFSVGLWNAETGAHLGYFADHDRQVDALKFSPDGQQLVSVAHDGLVALRSLTDRHDSVDTSKIATDDLGLQKKRTSLSTKIATLDKKWDFSHHFALNKMSSQYHWINNLCASFPENVDMIAISCGTGFLHIFRTIDGSIAYSLKYEDNLDNVAFSPDGTQVAWIRSTPQRKHWEASQLELRDIESNCMVWRQERFPSIKESLVYSPDGQLIASYDGNDRIVLSSAKSGSIIHTTSDQPLANILAFAPQSDILLSAGFFNRIDMWDVADIINTDSGSTRTCTDILHSDFDSVCADFERMISDFDIFHPDFVRWITADISCFEFTPTDHGSITITHRTVKWHHGRDKSTFVRFSRSGRLAAWVNEDAWIVCWVAGSKTKQLPNPSNINSQFYHSEGWGLEFSHDEHLIAANSSDGVLIWEVRTGTLLQKIDYATGPIAFGPDNTIAILKDPYDEQVVEVLCCRTGEILHAIDCWDDLKPREITLSADGELLALARESGLEVQCELWEVATNKMLETIQSNWNAPRLRFRDDNTALEYDRGYLPFQSLAGRKGSQSSKSLSKVWMEVEGREWIVRNKQRLFWLPPTFRGPVVVSGATVTISLRLGHLAEIDLSCMDQAELVETKGISRGLVRY